jgi:hypothetical protein
VGSTARPSLFEVEMSAYTSLAPLYGSSPRGRGDFFKLPRNRGTNTMLLSSLSLDGMGSSMATQGSTTEEVFEAYIEHFAAPKFHEGEPLCDSAAWNTTEHSGGLVLLTTPQRNLHTRFANSSQKDPADTLAR